MVTGATDGEPVGPARLSARAERSRSAILAAVEELIDRVGVRRLRIEDVAAWAGVSRQTVTNHFGTKDELVRTWAEIEHRRLAEVFLAVVSEGPDVAGGLTRGALEVLRFLQDRPGMQEPLRQDLVVYLARAGAHFPDLFSEVLAEGLTQLPGVDEERALVASQVCYRLVDSFATKPTDQLSLPTQAAGLSAAVMAVLYPGG